MLYSSVLQGSLWATLQSTILSMLAYLDFEEVGGEVEYGAEHMQLLVPLLLMSLIIVLVPSSIE